jgi:hypothetical protein
MSTRISHRAGLTAAAAAVLVVAWGGVASAQDAAAVPKNEATNEATKFVRLVQGRDGAPQALQTAIVRYEVPTADGRTLQVDLVAVIHIADRKYYEQLNREFEQYDAVLYELVGPRDAAPARGEAGIYGPVASFLGLSDQLAVIDYRRKNFVHADMTGEEFLRSMEERQESLVKMFFRMMGQAIVEDSKRSGSSDADLLLALFSSDRHTALKRVLVRQFDNIDQQMSWMVGPDGSTLITERNKVALRVLKEQIDAGKTRLAIFYGGGHMSDIERRLIADFGARKVDQRWLVAWDLNPRDRGASGQDDAIPEKPSRPRRQRNQPQPAAAP